jgi:hypothetical protein
MKNRRASTILLLTIIVTGSGYAAPSVSKHEPDFSLTISTDKSTITAQDNPGVLVDVKEKNISDHIVNIGREGGPERWYRMTVLLDGSPAKLTAEGKESLLPKPYNPNVPLVGSVFFGTLKPGKTRDFEVPLSLYFDFSTPGDYEITFARGTDPGQPDNVEVKSNTITVTVVAPENSPAGGSGPGSSSNGSGANGTSVTGGRGASAVGPTPNSAALAKLEAAMKKRKPEFSLSIAADSAATKAYPALHRVRVTYTNVSSRIWLNRFRAQTKNMYNMVVTRAGVPVAELPAMKELAQFRKDSLASSYIFHPSSLRPGQSMTTSLDVSDYYDMSQPGTYEITVTRLTQPRFPQASSLVRSNTITITVPERTTEAENPPRPEAQFMLNLSRLHPYAAPPPSMLKVEMLNTSNRVIRMAYCWTFMGMYNLVVTRDGTPVPPSEDMLYVQKMRSAVTCNGNDTIVKIQPGDSRVEEIPIENYYDVSRPGVYEIYVTRESRPYYPTKSVLVESNAISFEVPASSAPQ